MKRGAAARLFAQRLAAEDIVVCGLGSTSRAWREQRAPHLTYYASDPMGMAPSLALGLALARQERRIVLLEGDGDLVMNLGVLLTIAGAAPPNLRVAAFINDRYETGGGQPLPNATRIAFAQIAAGAGWRWTGEAHDESQAPRLISGLLEVEGPGFLALHVEAEASPYPADPGPTSQAEDRAAFQRRLLGGS
jgi:thiamine pyrophosphate-dependent acetolactate synthase large subunit-like protein